jgi:hypothetical protein
LVLQRLLRGEPLTDTWHPSLGREVLLAFHFWMLDYTADGQRQGFPFDPYLLYLHRRLLRGHDALTRLLQRPDVAAQAPATLRNLREQLARYQQDEQITAAARHYEIAYREFDRLRTLLRLGAQGDCPMRETYELTPGDEHVLRAELTTFCEQCRQRATESSDERERQSAQTVLTHVEKYLPYLLPSPGSGPSDGVRTTNSLEGYWSQSKRGCRHTQGRRKLTRTFEALPSELMLIPNLNNPEYVAIVLDGSLETLAWKFAEAQAESGSYTEWRKTNHSLNLGRLPPRVLRRTNFLDHLSDLYDHECHHQTKLNA